MNGTRDLGWRLCVAGALLAGVVGCRHKLPPPPPPAVVAPPLAPSSMTQEQQLPAVPPPSGKKVGAPGSDKSVQKAPEQAVPVKRPKRVKKRAPVVESAATTAPPVAAAPAQAMAQAPPQPSLGELSAGRVADSRESAGMIEEIRTQDTRLTAIKRPLSDESEAIAAQVRAFLAKARQAVRENDLDGARTLTTKAKVLLDELSGP